MNRVINNPDRVVEYMLVGILAAHPELAAAVATLDTGRAHYMEKG